MPKNNRKDNSTGNSYKIFHSQKEHAQFLVQEIKAKKINKLFLSSFGLWTGINNDGSPSTFSKDNPTAKILETAKEFNIHTEVIIGIPPFSSRAGFKNPPCIYCADAHRRMLQRIVQCRKAWPLIHWFFHPQNHTKLAIGTKNDTPLWAITGGHNLADSKLEDFSILLEGPTAGNQLLNVFESLKEKSEPDLTNIRLSFEENIKNAEAPKPPQNQKTQEGDSPAKGIFQSKKNADIPLRKIPPKEDLISLLYALAKHHYLSKEEFTRVARSSAWIFNQKTGKLHPKTKEAFGKDPLVQKAIKTFCKSRSIPL